MQSIDKLKAATAQALYRKAKKLIPGGTQLLSKRPEMFAPEVWPPYYSRARGTRVWDLDGQEYLDMSSMGIGAAILGYADPDVDGAVMESIRQGVVSSLNCPEEVDLAERMIGLHPWAGMIRYARSGGEAMAMAVRIARAATRRDRVFFSGYHGWTDWYLAANLGETGALDGQLMPGLEPRGVPRGLKGSAIPFHFNDWNELKKALSGQEKEVAAIVVEPARGEEAPPDFLKNLRDYASELGAVLIFDEITTGFRMGAGGIHLRYGINPDIAVFAKAIANGYAMAAVLGVERVMQAAQSTFISSTNWTERIGPTAALATIQKYEREGAAAHILAMGQAVRKIWTEKARKHRLEIKVSGIPTLSAFGFQNPQAVELDTVFTVEMLRRGILGFRQFKPSLAHTPADISAYEAAVEDVFHLIAQKGAALLTTPPRHAGFHRLTKE